MIDPAWLEFALRGAALALSALLLCAAFLRATAALRSGLLASALLALIALPLLGPALPRWEAAVLPETLPATPSAPAPGTAQTPMASMRGAASLDQDVAAAPAARPRSGQTPPPRAEVAAYAPLPAPPVANGTVPPAGPSGLPWPWLLWAVGFAAVLAPWSLGLVRAARWARSGVPLALPAPSAAAGLPVRVHPQVRCPMTVGLWHPVILLPTAARSWSERMLGAVLLHEAAHARRRDVLAGAAARWACALHWFDPLVWFAAARRRRESEVACDAAVLRAGVRPSALADTLVRISRDAGASSLHGAGATWRRCDLERRVDALLTPRSPRRRSAAGPVAAAAALALAVAFFAAGALDPTPVAHADAVVLTVGTADADHATIQAAVDAAPSGAQIRIAAGEYLEHVTVDKPLTLEGAGWETTRLHAAWTAPEERGRRPAPTLSIRGEGPVVLRGLRLALDGQRKDGVSLAGAAVDIEGAEVRMEACAVVPSPASGVDVSGDANVRIERCLIAAIGSTGIAIGSRGAGMPRVRVIDCDVRYGHSRGITVGASCDDVVVEGCRISGSAWHGIRYDNASPTIRRNRITNNVRSAIYASGRTRATIEGNLFADTGMAGVGCWFQCGDVIVRNTFAHNARAHLEILGASNPTVRRNVFHGSRAGIRWSAIASRGGGGASEGLGVVQENVFWACGEDTSRPVPDELFNVHLDPGLGDDYVLTANGAARARGAGAHALPPARSPFPEQPEEKAARKLFDEHLAKYGEWGESTGGPEPLHPSTAPSPGPSLAQRQAAARERSKAWLAAVRSLGDAAARAQALDEIFQALESPDDELRLAALRTTRWLGPVAYDRDAFRARILPQARSEDAAVRHAARAALFGVRPDPADLGLWLDEAQHADRSTAETTAFNLVRLAEGVVRGEVAAAVLHLLRDGTDIKKAFVIRGLQQVKEWDPRVEARLIEIVRSVPAHDYDSAYYFHFVTPRLDPKSDAVVDLILDRVGEGQGSLGTMLRGLRSGLSGTQRRHVVERLFHFLENAGSEHAQRELIQALDVQVDERDVARFEALLAREDLPASTRKLLDGALGAAKSRTPR